MTRTTNMTEGKRDFASSVWCVRGHEYQAINPSPSEALD